MPSKKKRYGLVLVLGGAPATPHVVAGVPGYFRPDLPTPVGEDGEISVDDAKEFGKLDVLEFVEISEKQAKASKALSNKTESAARQNLETAASVAEGAEASLIREEKAALAAKE